MTSPIDIYQDVEVNYSSMMPSNRFSVSQILPKPSSSQSNKASYNDSSDNDHSTQSSKEKSVKKSKTTKVSTPSQIGNNSRKNHVDSSDESSIDSSDEELNIDSSDDDSTQSSKEKSFKKSKTAKVSTSSQISNNSRKNHVDSNDESSMDDGIDEDLVQSNRKSTKNSSSLKRKKSSKEKSFKKSKTAKVSTSSQISNNSKNSVDSSDCKSSVDNSQSFLTEYFTVGFDSKGISAYIVKPDKVQMLCSMIEKNNAFPHFLSTVTQCQNSMANLAQEYPALFKAEDFSTEVNGQMYSIPNKIIQLIIVPKMTQDNCLTILCQKHFKKEPEQLSETERAVLMALFETLKKWPRDGVRKSINRLKNKPKQ